MRMREGYCLWIYDLAFDLLQINTHTHTMDMHFRLDTWTLLFNKLVIILS